jgi:hypothetical protein
MRPSNPLKNRPLQAFHYIILVDRDQAGQTLFLRSLTKGAAKHRGIRGIFVHTDNERTDLLLQEGIMRSDARKRVIRETNRRLVDLFAEAGVGAVGMQWHQMGNVDAAGVLTFTNDPRTRIPHSTHLILSNLADEHGDVIPLEILGGKLSETLSLPLIKVQAARLDGVFVHRETEIGEPADTTAGRNVQNINMDTWNTLQDYIFGA